MSVHVLSAESPVVVFQFPVVRCTYREGAPTLFSTRGTGGLSSSEGPFPFRSLGLNLSLGTKTFVNRFSLMLNYVFIDSGTLRFFF